MMLNQKVDATFFVAFHKLQDAQKFSNLLQNEKEREDLAGFSFEIKEGEPCVSFRGDVPVEYVPEIIPSWDDPGEPACLEGYLCEEDIAEEIRNIAKSIGIAAVDIIHMQFSSTSEEELMQQGEKELEKLAKEEDAYYASLFEHDNER